MYTTLLMSTGLTFGTISALYGLSHELITQEQYAVLVTAVILSAIVPTVIADRWFAPGIEPVEEQLARRAADRMPAMSADQGPVQVGPNKGDASHVS